MAQSKPIDPFEEALGAALRESSGTCPPGCPSPEILIDLIEQGGGHPDAEQLLLHLADCGDCMRDYGELRHTVRTGAEAVKAQSSPAVKRKADSWDWRMGFRLPALGAALGAILLTFVGIRAIWQSPNRATSELAYVQAAERSLQISFQVDVPHGFEQERGEDSGLQPVAPVGVCTESTRPTLEWRDDRSGGTYRVSVYQGEKKVAESDPIHETSWTPPVDLPRGEGTVWYVRETSGDRESRAAHFRVLSAKDQVRLADGLKRTSGQPLRQAIVLASFGLRDQALKELSALSDSKAQALKADILSKMPFGQR